MPQAGACHHAGMDVVAALPRHGEVFFDPRGGDRSLRVSWHEDAGLVVLSLWQAERCAGTFRLPVAEVPTLVNALVTGLATAVPVPSGRRAAG